MNKIATGLTATALVVGGGAATYMATAPEEPVVVEGDFVTTYSADTGVTLTLTDDAVSDKPTYIVWQAWMEQEEQVAVLGQHGGPDEDYLLPTSELMPLQGRGPYQLQALWPNNGLLGRMRFNVPNEPENPMPPVTPDPPTVDADAEIMVNIVINEDGAYANIIGLKYEDGGDVGLIPITRVSINMPAELTEQLDRIEAALVSGGPTVPPADRLRLNINTATFDELVALSGVGRVKAGAIIAERDRPGSNGFTSWDDFAIRVSGVGPGTIADIQADPNIEAVIE